MFYFIKFDCDPCEISYMVLLNPTGYYYSKVNPKIMQHHRYVKSEIMGYLSFLNTR